MSLSSPRLKTIDALRGAAVVGMIFFHFWFMLYWLGWPVSMTSWPIRLLGMAVRTTFVSLVGVSAALSTRSHRELPIRARLVRRAAVIGGWAIAVSVVTWWLLPDQWVRFGVLHLISLGLLVLAISYHHQRKLLASGIMLIGLWYGRSWLPEIWWLGLGTTAVKSLDFFPLIPWLGYPLFWFGLTSETINNPKRRDWLLNCDQQLPALSWLTVIGRHSLSWYLLHLPVVFTAATWLTYMTTVNN